MDIFDNFLAAAAAGFWASILTHPIDVVKTNLMVSKSIVSPTYKAVFWNIYQKSGLMGFWKGFLMRTLQMSITSIVLLIGYEQVLNYGLIRIPPG